MKNNKYFILMADIISSRSYSQKELMYRFSDISNYINIKCKNNFISPITITLGDEFQCIVNDTTSAIKIIFEFEEQIIHKNLDFKLRYVLIRGEIDTPINTKIAYGMMGNGLTRARELLMYIKKLKLRFFLEIGDKKLDNALNNAFNIYRSYVDEWELDKDYDLVSNFLYEDDYKKVSEYLNKNRSQIWKREKNLKIKEYNSIKEVIKYLGEISTC